MSITSSRCIVLLLAGLMLLGVAVATDAPATADEPGPVAAAQPWVPESNDDLHLFHAWRIREVDAVLRAQGRSEPWATDTEAVITEWLTMHLPTSTQLHLVACGETFCRVSLEFENEGAREMLHDAAMDDSPDFLRSEWGGWNRGEVYLELVIAREGYTQPDVGRPQTRPDPSVLENFSE